MEKNIHLQTAEAFFKIAEEKNQEYEKETDKVTYRGENGQKYENIKKLARRLAERNEE